MVAHFFGVIPDAVAGQEDKLDASTVNYLDFWLAADHLRKLILTFSFLEFEVSEASRYGQLSLNATLINKAACIFDSSLFMRVIRLVVL